MSAKDTLSQELNFELINICDMHSWPQYRLGACLPVRKGGLVKPPGSWSPTKSLRRKISSLYLNTEKNYIYTQNSWSKLDESTARRQLKSPQSLSGRSIHLTLFTKWSWSWSWMTHCHLLCAMSIGPPILRYSYFKIWPWKSMVKVMCVVKAQGHI